MPARAGAEPTDAGPLPFGGEVGATPDADSDGAAGDVDASVGDAGKPGAPIGYTTRASCGYTEFDPHNCGTCGHDCQGGACQGGACVPLPPGVLASGLIAPVSVAVDSANVYWLSQGLHAVSTQNQAVIGSAALMKCAKTGCNNRPTVLASGSWDDASARDRLEGIVSDGTNVYWAANNAILSCAVNGCDNQPAQIVSPVSGTPPWSISVNATRVFGASADGVFACALGGCIDSSDAGNPVDSGGPEYLWAGSVTAVAIDSTTVFWNSYGAMLSCAIGGCNGTPRLLTSPTGEWPFVGQIAVDQANVYWALGTPPPSATTNTNVVNPGYALLFLWGAPPRLSGAPRAGAMVRGSFSRTDLQCRWAWRPTERACTSPRRVALRRRGTTWGASPRLPSPRLEGQARPSPITSRTPGGSPSMLRTCTGPTLDPASSTPTR